MCFFIFIVSFQGPFWKVTEKSHTKPVYFFTSGYMLKINIYYFYTEIVFLYFASVMFY